MDHPEHRDGVLLGLFLGSGCAALIYEVVWFQQLGLVLGASAVSLAILLASFMGGMCLGSFAFARFVSPTHHPLRVYAVMELLIAVCGLIILHALPTVGRIYWAFSSPGSSDLPLRAFVAAMILLPPTILMGATLPAVSRWVESSREGLARLGLFYGANTLGAVAGSLFTGLLLLRLFDVAVATYVAAALNIAVAAVAWRFAGKSPYAVPSPTDVREPEAKGNTIVFLVAGLSGLTALGCEVVWTRLLALEFGPTVYTFSILLAVFLLGLGLGSGWGAKLSRRVAAPAAVLGVVQLGLTLAISYSAFVMFRVLPYWWADQDPGEPLWSRMGFDIIRAAAAFLPTTCLWGMTFPLAVAAAAGRERDPGRLVGRLYAANTLGAICGALVVSLIIVPRMGSQFALQSMLFLSGCSGLLMLGHWLLKEVAARSPSESSLRTLLVPATGLLAVAAALPFLPRMVAEVPLGLFTWGRIVDRWETTRQYFFVAEGLDSSIVIAESQEGNRCFHVSGKVEATNSPSDMRTQRILGHLPALVHGNPKRVLVVGCGSGMTTGAFLKHPSVEEIVLCEMERNVITAARENFAPQNYGVLDDPKTTIVIDDARHFLATCRDKFDVITTDPIHPWVRGAASLYTAEFYELCRSRLNPGGVITQWVPLYESNEPAVRCELATLLATFPHAAMWSGEGVGQGYDIVVVATEQPAAMSPEAMAERLASNADAQESLAEIGLGSLADLQQSFVGYGVEVTDWLRGAEINRDCNLRLQYLAGLTQGTISEKTILRAINRQRRRESAESAEPNEPLSILGN